MNETLNSNADLFVKFNKLIVVKFYGFLVVFQSPSISLATWFMQ